MTVSRAVTRSVDLTGHLIDSLTLSKVLDTILRHKGSFEINDFRIGAGNNDVSHARITIHADDDETLQAIIKDIQPHIDRTPTITIADSENIPVCVAETHPHRRASDVIQPSPVGKDGIPKILMCAPDYFTVEYAINPWMREGGPADTELAKKQWEQLHNAIEREADAKVLLMDPVDGLPDLVFTANAAFVYGNKAIIAHYKFPERQGEEPHAEAWFKKHGFEVSTMPDGIHFEGAGDALIWQDRVFAGYRTRTDLASHNLITATTGLPVLSLELISGHFYHIDVCICPLYDGHFIYYPDAFDEYGKSVIAANVPKDKLIPVTAEEAARFACNTVAINDTVFFNQQGSSRLSDELKSRGFKVVQVDMSEFIKSGGSSKCLTLRVG